MIASLQITNLALIEDLEVAFDYGLNIITGETGAGKSIVIGALQLILGQRADRSLIRRGENSCTVSAVLQLQNNSQLLGQINTILGNAGVPACEDGQLLLRREIGKISRNFVNATPTTLQLLADLGDLLVDVHGPYDHQSLLQTRRQLLVLDAFAGLDETRKSCARLAANVTALDAELAALAKEAPSPERIELLRFQLREIRDAAVQPGEDLELQQRHSLAANSQRVLELLAQAQELLRAEESGITDHLGAVMRALYELERLSPDLAAGLIGQLDGIAAGVQSLADDLADAADSAEMNPAEFAQLEDRMALLQKLKRKYGGSLEQVLTTAAEAAAMLDRLEHYDSHRASLQTQRDEATAALRETSLTLSRKRQRAARELAKRIAGKLRSLGFKECGFGIELTAVAPGPTGMDAIEFCFAPNVGEGSKSLRAIASSGEIARVMLAIKTVLAAADAVPILVFDEVDANIGGVVATAVGHELRRLGDDRQVLCITHLPQVAAGAHRHLRVDKLVKRGRTRTLLTLLDRDGQIGELARMLGDSGRSPVVREHATDLIDKAMATTATV